MATEYVAPATTAQPARTRSRNRLALTGAAVFSWVLGGFESFTWPSYVGVALANVGLLSIAWWSPPRRMPAPPRLHPVGISAWWVLILGFSAWELIAFFSRPASQHPTLSDLLDPVLANHLGRSTAVALWLTFGAYLVRR